MVIGATDITFGDFLFQAIKRGPPDDHGSHIAKFFASNMVEVEDGKFGKPTVYAGVGCEVLIHIFLLRRYSALLVRALACGVLVWMSRLPRIPAGFF